VSLIADHSNLDFPAPTGRVLEQWVQLALFEAYVLLQAVPLYALGKSTAGRGATCSSASPVPAYGVRFGRGGRWPQTPLATLPEKAGSPETKREGPLTSFEGRLAARGRRQ
jgi:hypothetical protein